MHELSVARLHYICATPVICIGDLGLKHFAKHLEIHDRFGLIHVLSLILGEEPDNLLIAL